MKKLFVALLAFAMLGATYAEEDLQSSFWDWFYSKAARTQTGRKVRRQAETFGIRQRSFKEKCVDIYDDFKESVDYTVTKVKNGATAVSHSIANSYTWLKSKIISQPDSAPLSISGEVP